MQAAGYQGTELGPRGFLPTDAAELAVALQSRGLELAAAFLFLDLNDQDADAVCEARVRETAQLLQRLGARHILLADAGDEVRYQVAGRPELVRRHGLTSPEWVRFTRRLERLAQVCRFDYGLVPCFHPHGATYVESPDEIRILMDRTDPHLLMLCLDTGHVAFGGGDPMEVTHAYASRLGHIHLKDIDLPRLRAVQADGSNYVDVTKQGVFVELGQGSLDISGLFSVLQSCQYDGWVVVEQDRVVGAETDTLGSARRNREYLRERLGM